MRNYLLKNGKGEVIGNINSSEELHLEEEIDLSIDLSKYSKTFLQPNPLSGPQLMCVRTCGNLASKSFYLTTDYNWELKKDDVGSLCLVPTKKR